MTTLHDRLVDLAEAAPEALPAPGLWDRGLSYRRRRRAGTAVVLVVAAVALVVLGSVTWLRSPQTAELLPADSPGGLPDRLYTPSRWLPGTDNRPLGTIAAVIPADRGTWSGTDDRGLVGVSAVTGEYRFLDLPRLASNLGPVWALSPDGRYVAYLYQEGDLAGSADATGLALYDSTTGQTRLHVLRDGQGIQLSHDNLAWAGDDIVMLTWSTTDGISGDNLVAWNVHVEAPQTLAARGSVISILGAGPGFVVVASSRELVVADPGTGLVLRDLRAPLRGSRQVFDASSTRFAVRVTTGLGSQVLVGTLARDPDDPPSYVEVPRSETVEDAVAWVGADHLAVRRLDPVGGAEAVENIDVRTGAVGNRVLLAPGQHGGVQLATELLARPTVAAVAPAHPLDPRLVKVGGAAIVLLAGLAAILWRRRVRP
jgi:hypothetical protein